MSEHLDSIQRLRDLGANLSVDDFDKIERVHVNPKGRRKQPDKIIALLEPRIIELDGKALFG